MNIIGLGTDIVEIARIRESISKFGQHFCDRVYTAAELLEAEKRKNTAIFFAGRWAAKEAAAKALGCGIGEKCAFTDIEIINDENGRPVMRFCGDADVFAGRCGVSEIKLSISHESNYAVATVVLCGK